MASEVQPYPLATSIPILEADEWDAADVQFSERPRCSTPLCELTAQADLHGICRSCYERKIRPERKQRRQLDALIAKKIATGEAVRVVETKDCAFPNCGAARYRRAPYCRRHKTAVQKQVELELHRTGNLPVKDHPAV